MTWSIKVVRVLLAVGSLAALALASGANYVDIGLWFDWSW